MLQDDATGKEQALLPKASYKDCANKEKDVSINTSYGIKYYCFHILLFPLEILSIAQDRLFNYESALSIAKLNGESSKVRRYERSIKLSREIIETIKTGKQVDIGELPPKVPVPSRPKETNIGVKRPTDGFCSQENSMDYHHFYYIFFFIYSRCEEALGGIFSCFR